MRWPGKIPAAASCDELASTIDILPTMAHLIRAKLPEHKIDGREYPTPAIRRARRTLTPLGLLFLLREWPAPGCPGPPLETPFSPQVRTLAGRQGGTGGQPVRYAESEIGLELFDLKQDVGETIDLASKHPDVVERLKRYADQAREDLGDALNQRKGEGVRGSGQLGADEVRLKW